jgi:hypothetical protein
MVAKTVDGEEYSTFREFDESAAKKIDNPFEYIHKLGLNGWEMVGFSTITMDKGVARIYVFAKAG